MLDLRHNLLTAILLGAVAVFVLSAVGMALLFGRVDMEQIEASSAAQVSDVEVDVPETGLADLEEYAAILERPVFFSDRQLPVVEAADGDEEEQVAVEESEPEEAAELDAIVAGIVITPDMKLAMVNDRVADKTFVLREGMSLEGEQAAWKLESILPRAVSFVSVDGRQKDLELKVHTSGLGGGASRRRREGPTESESPESGEPESAEQSADSASEEARARAEEIRRRVAERRAQLRAEAERRAREQQQEQDNNG